MLALTGSLSLAMGAPPLMELREQFSQFKLQFNKTYAPEEEGARFNAFLGNLRLIDMRNAEEGPNGATHGWTKFIDLTPDEFAGMYLTARPGPKKFAERVELPELGEGEQASADWTGKYTTAVKDQGQCGSCWAFSATEQIESDAMRELGDKYELSPMQITACDKYDDGCGGGNTETAYRYAEGSKGMVTEKDYPYTAGHGGKHLTCDSADLSDPVVSVKSYKTIKSSNGAAGVESAMASYVGKTGPLSICVDAQSWQTYKSGVLTRCGKSIDHCVQAVGIDTGAGVWKVRNSWNTNWGESGFIRLTYGADACGLTNDPTWVSVASAAKTVEESA